MALFDSIPAYAIFSSVEINRKSQLNELINAFPNDPVPPVIKILVII